MPKKYTMEQLNSSLQEAIKLELKSGAIEGAEYYRKMQDGIKKRMEKLANSRLEYLRGELRAERISYGELAELQSLKNYIKSGDVELLEPAGVPEFPEDN